MKKMIAILAIGMMTVTSMMVLAGCKTVTEKTCRIHGTMESDRWEGKKIFLVPMFGLQDAAHVDSVVIKDRKFEFTTDTTEMKVIRVDYHYRDGVQDLLLVSEPGNVNVMIGANSTTAGTPQNDSLQVWKDRQMKFNLEYQKLRVQASEGGNVDSLKAKGNELVQELKENNMKFAKRMAPGVLKDFLCTMYPSK